MRDVSGRMQEAAGKMVLSSKKQPGEGLKTRAVGKVQKGIGDLKETAENG